jgi:hypothetical protein
MIYSQSSRTQSHSRIREVWAKSFGTKLVTWKWSILTCDASDNSCWLQPSEEDHFVTVLNKCLWELLLLRAKSALLILYVKWVKGKAIPVTGHGGPQGCETLRIPQYLDNRLTDGGKVVSLTRRPPFTPQKGSWYSFLLEAEDEKFHLIGTRTRDLPACSIVPQPTEDS